MPDKERKGVITRTCECMRMRVHTHTHTHTHASSHTYTHASTHTHTHTYKHAHTHTHTHTHTCLNTHTHTPQYRHTHTHTHMPQHTHTHFPQHTLTGVWCWVHWFPNYHSWEWGLAGGIMEFLWVKIRLHLLFYDSATTFGDNLWWAKKKYERRTWFCALPFIAPRISSNSEPKHDSCCQTTMELKNGSFMHRLPVLCCSLETRRSCA